MNNLIVFNAFGRSIPHPLEFVCTRVPVWPGIDCRLRIDNDQFHCACIPDSGTSQIRTSCPEQLPVSWWFARDRRQAPINFHGLRQMVNLPVLLFLSAFVGRSVQFNRLSMWCVPVSAGPGFFSREQRRGIRKAFCSDQTLKCGKPMFVVV